MPNSINRLTVIGQVVHQNHGHNPSVFVFSGNVQLSEGQEQPYLRETSVDEHWHKLSYGWVESPYSVSIKNDSEFSMYYAYSDDRDHEWVIPPGMGVVLYPTSGLAIRSDGVSKYQLYAVKG